MKLGARTWLWASCIVVTLAHTGAAQVTTHDAGAVLVFPKVIADGTWDTVIQIANDANRPTYAHCYYVNGALTDPGVPPGPLNPPVWSQTDFPLFLTRLQPTHWVVSRGRLDDPSDLTCRGRPLPSYDCDGAGFDPGLVPAAPPDFTGELLCVEVDASGAPWSGNALRGLATLTHVASGEVAKYPAVGLPGLDANNADGQLCLGGNGRSGCEKGAEYTGCPQTWIINHPSDFDDRPVDGDAVSTALTVVPCAHNFETQTPAPITLQFTITNELEQQFTAATTVTCWANNQLSDINPVFQRDHLGGDWAQTRIRAAGGTPHGFMVVQQTDHETARGALIAATAAAGTVADSSTEADLIVIPQEQIP